MAEELGVQASIKIVVNNTPDPNSYRGPDQLLKDLGVIGDNETETHKAGIIKDVEARGLTIDASDITSGPAVNVGDCAASVIANAS